MLPSCGTGPVGRLLAVQRDNAREDRGNLLRGVELARLLAGTGGELADQIFVGVAQRIGVLGKFRQPLGDFLDDVAELFVFIRVRLAELFRAKVDLGEKALKGALEGFVFDVFETVPQGFEQLPALLARQVCDAGPEMVRLDDVMHLAPHLLLEIAHVIGIVGIPDGQRHTVLVGGQLGIILPQLAGGGGLVIVGEITQKEEGQHVVAEVVGVHRPPQLVGDVPQGLAQALLVLSGHAKREMLENQSQTWRSSYSTPYFFRNRPIFFLKGARPVVFLLPIYVMEQCVTVGRADGERAVAALPGKHGQRRRLRFEPFGRRRFQAFDEIGHGDGARKPDGEMNVIGDTANAKAFAIRVPGDRGEIGVKRGTDFRAKERCAVLRGENDVDEKE